MFVNINDKGQRKMSENDGTYKALLLSYNKLKEENELLKAEVVELRKLLGKSDHSEGEHLKSSDETSAINKYSSSIEKIDLFRSLFKGREDVLPVVGKVRPQARVDISPCVKMNGQRDCAIRENSSVSTVQTEI